MCQFLVKCPKPDDEYKKLICVFGKFCSIHKIIITLESFKILLNLSKKEITDTVPCLQLLVLDNELQFVLRVSRELAPDLSFPSRTSVASLSAAAIQMNSLQSVTA